MEMSSDYTSQIIKIRFKILVTFFEQQGFFLLIYPILCTFFQNRREYEDRNIPTSPTNPNKTFNSNNNNNNNAGSASDVPLVTHKPYVPAYKYNTI